MLIRRESFVWFIAAGCLLIAACNSAGSGSSTAGGTAAAIVAPLTPQASVTASPGTTQLNVYIAGPTSPQPGQSLASHATQSASRQAKDAGEGTQAFYDDFEDSSTVNWQVVSPAWSICGPPTFSHEYCGNSAGAFEALSFAGSSSWTNTRTEAFVKPTDPRGNVGLLARVSDSSHYYQFELRPWNGQSSWFIWRRSGTAWVEVSGGSFPYVANTYYRMRLDAVGTTLTASISMDGGQTYTVLGAGTDTAYSAGKIGTRVWGGAAGTFDLITVNPITPPAPQALNSSITLAAGLTGSVIANVSGARELTALPNGDLLVGSEGSTISIVRNAEAAGTSDGATTFATLPDTQATSVFYAPNGTVYVGTNSHVYALGYTPGSLTAGPIHSIANIRTGGLGNRPSGDTDLHTTSSVIATATNLYVAAGSSCNACTEVDPTRAAVQIMNLDGSNMTVKATRIRNAMALAIEPTTQNVWAGGAGQDNLATGHPYEYFDPITAHGAVADYGWPVCEENAQVTPGAPANSCAGVITPAAEFPAYSTLIGAQFYPLHPHGLYALPQSFAGGVFVGVHGSWHNGGSGNSAVQPHVAFIPFANGSPASPVNWNDPTTQAIPIMTGFGVTAGSRIGRPTGIAVGSQGSVFVADDQSGNIYRLRPTPH